MTIDTLSDPTETYYTVTEIAGAHGVTPATVKRWVHMGFYCVVKFDRTLVIPALCEYGHCGKLHRPRIHLTDYRT